MCYNVIAYDYIVYNYLKCLSNILKFLKESISTYLKLSNLHTIRVLKIIYILQSCLIYQWS